MILGFLVFGLLHMIKDSYFIVHGSKSFTRKVLGILLCWCIDSITVHTLIKIIKNVKIL